MDWGRACTRYLARHCEASRRGEGDRGDGTSMAVVIPCLGEGETLGETLAALCANSAEARAATRVVVVVNNRSPDQTDAEDLKQNRATLAALRTGFDGLADTLRLAWFDASSPGRELPSREGVGLARKIGLDGAFRRLLEQGMPQGALVCLDGDTVAAPGYLDAMHAFFAAPGRWAAVIPYAHRPGRDAAEHAAILAYELHLRCHEAGLARAASPYAYTAIGSALACTAAAYGAVQGMPKRQAGEDFYFLGKLAKLGPVETVPGARVHPSARPSHRVPFGTGRAVLRHLAEGPGADLTYHPESYRRLGQWLALAEAHTEAEGAALVAAAEQVWPGFRPVLEGLGFAPSWDRIRDNAKTAARRRQQFHGWFDAFRTLKFMHGLRDTALPDQPLADCLAALASASSDLDLADFAGLCTENVPGRERALGLLRARAEGRMQCGGLKA